MIEISIVVPAYNEADNITACLRDTEAAARGLFKSYEIIVVDDGSGDGTGDMAQRYADANPAVRVVRKTNGGIGSAVVAGFREARGKLLTYTPADNQFDFSEMRHMLKVLPQADLVVGYKRRYDYYTPMRKALSFAARLTLRLFFGVHLRDVNFIHLYKAESYPQITPKSAGAFFHSETLARAVKHRLRIVEVPLSLKPRTSGASTGGSLRTVRRAFVEMLRYVLKG